MMSSSIAVLLFSVVICSCGSSPAGKSDGAAGSGSGSGAVQYALMTVTGDQTSGVSPYKAEIEIDYDSDSLPTFHGGTCTQRYYAATGSGSDTPDGTEIRCNASVPTAIDGPADAGTPFPIPPAVQFRILLAGRVAPPVTLDTLSQPLASIAVQLYGGHNGWVAEYPATNGSNSPTDFSFKVEAANALPLPFPGFSAWTDYIMEAEGHATTPPTPGAPGTVTVSLNLSASSLTGGASDGGADGVVGAINGTCADLTVCCNAIADATAKSSCTSLATSYQSMVGKGFSQEQADAACDTFLHLERGSGLCN